MKTYFVVDLDNNGIYTDNIDNVPTGYRIFEYDAETDVYTEIFK
jgi:hypothetical protein